MKYTQEVKDYEKKTKFLTVQRDKRCVLCRSLPIHIHEIVPRSHFGVNSIINCFDIKNRICLCPNCHAEAANPDMRRKLLDYLVTNFGYEYPEPWYSRYVEN